MKIITVNSAHLVPLSAVAKKNEPRLYAITANKPLHFSKREKRIFPEQCIGESGSAVHREIALRQICNRDGD